MQLIAKTDFHARVDGREISMKKGEVFTGNAKEAEKLSSLLEKPVKKKGATNER